MMSPNRNAVDSVKCPRCNKGLFLYGDELLYAIDGGYTATCPSCGEKFEVQASLRFFVNGKLFDEKERVSDD